MEGQAANTLGIGKPKVNSYALYRKTTLGISLTDALDELTEKGSLTPAQATKVLEQFDKVRCPIRGKIKFAPFVSSLTIVALTS